MRIARSLSWGLLAWLGCWLLAVRDRRRRRARREARERRLDNLAASAHELDELTTLVDRVGRIAPLQVQHDDLESLLEAYADAAVLANAFMRGASREPRRYSELTRPCTRAVRIRAAAWQQRCAANSRAYHDRMAEIADLIRLYAQRAVFPEVSYVVEDGILDRTLAEPTRLARA